MSRLLQLHAAALLGVVLSACSGDPETVGGIIEQTDADSIASTGFPMAAVLATRSRQLDDGTRQNAVQFYPDQTDPARIAAAPAALCNGDGGRSVVSSRLTDPGPDEADVAGSKVLTAICK